MRGSLLRECSHPGCRTLTIGDACIRHDQPVTRIFQRGRPYPPAQLHARALTAPSLVAAEAPAVGLTTAR